MTLAQIIAHWPSWIVILTLIICVLWLRPTPGEYRALAAAWVLLIASLAVYALVGCASLPEDSTEVVTNSRGVQITRHYGVREFPPECPGSFTEGCYTPGHAWYLDRYPHSSTMYHEEEGHGNDMQHGPWYPCGQSMCAVVTQSGGHYVRGQIIVKSGHMECIAGNCRVIPSESLVGAKFKPIDRATLERIFK